MNRTLSTALDFLLIPAAATVAVVGVSSLIPANADATYVHPDGSATVCDVRDGLTGPVAKCRDITKEQRIQHLNIEADITNKYLRCRKSHGIETWAYSKCVGEMFPGEYLSQLSFNQSMCADFGGKYCKWVSDYEANQ